MRDIAAVGGFLEVAQALGYRSVRRPPGYWEDEAVLDRELSLFVAANWLEFEAEPEAEESESDESESDGDGSEGSAQQLREVGFRGVRGEAAATAPPPKPPPQAAAQPPREVYWYNQVTRRVRWTRPEMPELVPLDDEGSVLLAEGPDDRAMPSRNSLLAAGRYDLHSAVVAAGGYTQVAEDLDRWPAWPPTRVSWRVVWLLGRYLRAAPFLHLTEQLPASLPLCSTCGALARCEQSSGRSLSSMACPRAACPPPKSSRAWGGPT